LECTASTDCGEYKLNDTLCWGVVKTGAFALPSSVACLVKEGMLMIKSLAAQSRSTDQGQLDC
jgi:hypothetical protein